MSETNDLPQEDQSPKLVNPQVPEVLPEQTHVPVDTTEPVEEQPQMSDQPQESDLPQETEEIPAVKDNSLPKPNYQFFPDLLHEDEQALRKSIKEVGVLTAIIRDDEGNLIEGHQRKRIADEERIPCPEVVRHFETEQEKYQYALMVNSARRHLTSTQKRDVIAAYLKKDPEIANNWLAEILGVSVNTVISERKRLEATSQIEKLETLRGKDKKKRPRRNRRKKAKPTNLKPAPAATKNGEEPQAPAGEEPQAAPLPGDPQASASNGELTEDELQALIVFVEAVGGWAHAMWVMEKGERQWLENHGG